MSWQARLFAALLHHLLTQGRSARSARTTLGWAQRYILYSGNRHPAQLTLDAAGVFIAHLDRDLRLDRRAQRQALAAVRCVHGYAKGTVSVDTVADGLSRPR